MVETNATNETMLESSPTESKPISSPPPTPERLVSPSSSAPPSPPSSPIAKNNDKEDDATNKKNENLIVPLTLTKTLLTPSHTTFSTTDNGVEHCPMYPAVAEQMMVILKCSNNGVAAPPCRAEEKNDEDQTSIAIKDEKATPPLKEEQQPAETAKKPTGNDKSSISVDEKPSVCEPDQGKNDSDHQLDEGRFAKKVKSLKDKPKRDELVQTRLVCSSRSLSSNDLLEKLGEVGESETKKDEEISTEIPSEVEVRSDDDTDAELKEAMEIEVEKAIEKEVEEIVAEAETSIEVENDVDAATQREAAEIVAAAEAKAVDDDEQDVDTIIDEVVDGAVESSIVPESEVKPTAEEVKVNSEVKEEIMGVDESLVMDDDHDENPLPAVQIIDKVDTIKESRRRNERGAATFLSLAVLLSIVLAVTLWSPESFPPAPPHLLLPTTPNIIEVQQPKQRNRILSKLGKWRKKLIPKRKQNVVDVVDSASDIAPK